MFYSLDSIYVGSSGLLSLLDFKERKSINVMLKINTRGNVFHLEDIFLVFQTPETNPDYHSSGYAIKPMRIPDLPNISSMPASLLTVSLFL